MVAANASTIGIIRDTTYISAMTACAAGGFGVTLFKAMLEKYAENYAGRHAVGPIKTAGEAIETRGLNGIAFIEALLARSLEASDKYLLNWGVKANGELLRYLKAVSCPDLYESAVVVANFLSSINSQGTITEFLKGLKLLVNVHSETGSKLSSETAMVRKSLPHIDVVSNWEYGFKCAIAACGWKVLMLLRLSSRGSNELSTMALTGIDEIVVFEGSSTICRPAHYVGIDHSKKKVIVALRGTMELQDIITDLVCEQQEFESLLNTEGDETVKGMAHSGFLRAAKRLAEDLDDVVKKSLCRNEGYTLMVTGHSLGGGVASILTLLWAHDRFFQSRKIKCIAFGTPCSVSKSIALAPFSKKFIEAVTLDDDFVSRLSLASVTELSKVALLLSKEDENDTSTHHTIASQTFDDVEHMKLYPCGTVWHLPSYDIKCSTHFARIKITPSMFLVHWPIRYMDEIVKLKSVILANNEYEL